jgi:hypothetical protein
VDRVAARRASVHCPAGTIGTNPVNVTTKKYREFMIEKVLPAIKLKWPDQGRVIVIQQDGALSHINGDGPAFTEAVIAGNWQIQLVLTQPTQSPDTNILDLSFFKALQSPK